MSNEAYRNCKGLLQICLKKTRRYTKPSTNIFAKRSTGAWHRGHSGTTKELVERPFGGICNDGSLVKCNYSLHNVWLDWAALCVIIDGKLDKYVCNSSTVLTDFRMHLQVGSSKPCASFWVLRTWKALRIICISAGRPICFNKTIIARQRDFMADRREAWNIYMQSFTYTYIAQSCQATNSMHSNLIPSCPLLSLCKLCNVPNLFWLTRQRLYLPIHWGPDFHIVEGFATRRKQAH